MPHCPIAGDATAQIYHMQYKSNYRQNVFCIHRLFLCQAEARYVLLKRPSGRKANKQFSMFTANHANRRVCPLGCSTYFADHREATSYIISVVSVCLSVCQTMTFASLHVGSSYLHIRRIYRECGSSSYIKVIKSRSSHRAQQIENPHFLKCKTHIGNNSGSIKRTAMKFACSMVLSATAE